MARRARRITKAAVEQVIARAFDMEVPMTQAIELVRAIEMIGNGMTADHNDDGLSIATVASAASAHLDDLKRHWYRLLRAARKRRAA